MELIAPLLVLGGFALLILWLLRSANDGFAGRRRSSLSRGLGRVMGGWNAGVFPTSLRGGGPKVPPAPGDDDR